MGSRWIEAATRAEVPIALPIRVVRTRGCRKAFQPPAPQRKENIMVATDGTDTIANAPVKAQENIDGLIDAVGLAAILERVAERVRRRDEEQRQEIGALREELAKHGSQPDLLAAIDAVEVE